MSPLLYIQFIKAYIQRKHQWVFFDKQNSGWPHWAVRASAVPLCRVLPCHSTRFPSYWFHTQTPGWWPLPSRGPQRCYSCNPKWSKNICDILIISDHLTKCCLLSSHVLLLLTFCPLSMHSFHDTVFSTCFFCKEKKSLFPHHYKNMPCVIWLQTLDIYLRLELRIQTLSEMLPTFEGFWKLNEIRRFCPAAVTVSGSPGTIQMGACSPDKGNLFIVVSTIKQMLIDKQGLCTGRGKCQIIIVHNIVYTVHSIWRALLTHWSTAFVQTGISQKLLHGLLETLYRHSCCPRKDPLSFPLVPPWCCHFCFLCEMSWEMLDGFPWNLAYIFTVPREITTCFTDIHGPQTCSLHCV